MYREVRSNYPPILHSSILANFPVYFLCMKRSQAVRLVVAHDIDFAGQDRTADCHSNGDDGHVDASEFEARHMDVSASQDIAPQEAGQ